MKRAWFCSSCLFFLALSYMSAISASSAAKKNSNVDVLKEDAITFTQATKLDTNNASKSKLYERIEQISRAAQGRVGVAATVLETGRSVTLNGDRRFPMQSVYKFPIAMAILAQVDRGKLKLDQKVRIEASDIVKDSRILEENSQGKEFSLTELLKYMVSESDSTACDALLRLVGGAEVVTKYLRDLGINDIVVANTENEIQFGQDSALQYRNYATPDAAVNLLRAFHEGRGLSESSQALLWRWMTETSTGSQRIKGELPDGTVVAHKTGTSGTVDGVTAATNDVGLVTLPNGRHLAVAVFVSDSTADDATREEVIAKVARAMWNEWSK